MTSETDVPEHNNVVTENYATRVEVSLQHTNAQLGIAIVGPNTLLSFKTETLCSCPCPYIQP